MVTLLRHDSSIFSGVNRIGSHPLNKLHHLKSDNAVPFVKVVCTLSAIRNTRLSLYIYLWLVTKTKLLNGSVKLYL